MNFESLKQFIEFKIIKNDLKLPHGTGRIRPAAEGQLGAATCYGSGPS
jgi:hypothetical protein